MSVRSSTVSSVFAFALSTTTCLGSPPSDEERTPFAVPPRPGFEPVSDMLHARCGSLDCHGHVARNLRLYGVNGLRLSPSAVPGEEARFTTAAEHDQNHAAVVTLEPEVLDRVIRERGNDPGRLTLLRKARNTENHDGGEMISAGSDADRCIVSWLALSTDATACESAATFPRPVPR